MEIIDKDNPINKRSLGGTLKWDSIGLGMSKNKMLLFKLGEFDISGIICSGNN